MAVKVILRESVTNLGRRGDIVGVKPGYARNYLLPRGLALAATPGNLKVVEQQRRTWAAREAQEERQAQDLVRQVPSLQHRRLFVHLFVFFVIDDAHSNSLG